MEGGIFAKMEVGAVVYTMLISYELGEEVMLWF